MRVLITGGTGFLGGVLASRFMERGFKPVLLDPQPPRGALAKRQGEFHFMRASLTSLPILINAMRQYQVETVFHLGGMLSMPCERDPWSAFDSNAAGTFQVLEAARLCEVRQVVLASSIAVYGEDLPEGPIHDATLQRPSSMYGCCKVFGELLGRFFARRFGLDFRGLRLPSVVGPGSKVPHMSIYNCWAIEKPLLGEPYEILASPETRVPTIYYKDAARALDELALAPAEAIKTKVYNLSGFAPAYSAAELVEAVRAQVPGARLSFKPDPEIITLLDGIGRHPLDDSPARQEWGWKPAFDLAGMIADFRQELAKMGEENQ